MKFKNFKRWEKFLILFSSALIMISLWFYLSGTPFINYLFEIEDDLTLIQVGSLIEASGNVRQKISNETQFKNIDVGAAIYSSDVLVTEGDSRATVSLGTGSTLELEPNTMLKITFPTVSKLFGIQRKIYVNIVSGTVSGRAGILDIVLKSREQQIVLKANASKAAVNESVSAPKPVFLTNLTQTSILTPISIITRNSPPTPMPTPTLIPIRPVAALPRFDQLQLTKILSPFPGASIQVDLNKADPDKSIKLEWQIWGPARDVMIKVFKVQSGKVRTEEFIKVQKPQGDKIRIQRQDPKIGFDEVVKGSVIYIPKTAGKYELEILEKTGKPFSKAGITRAEFNVVAKTYSFSPPRLLLPKDEEVITLKNSKAKSQDILLSWEQTKDYSEYEIEISQNPEFSRIILKHKLKENLFHFKQILRGNYYWRVRGLNQYSSGVMSTTYRFFISELSKEPT